MEMTDKNDATVLLRLPNDLKLVLMREAAVHGRRITAEINMRLKASLHATGIAPAAVAGLLPKGYAALAGKTPDSGEVDAPVAGEQSEREKDLLNLFRAMSAVKQKALISLLK